jgi:hypothetical protein
MKVHSFKSRFTAIVKEILEEYFNNGYLDPLMDEKIEMVKKSAENDVYRTLDYGWTYEDYLNSFDEALGKHVTYGIKPFITARNQSALSQLITTNLNESDSKATIRVFPNPFSEVLYVQSSASNYLLKIYDITGQLVYSKHVNNAGPQLWNGTNQNGKKLTNGIYLIEINDFINNTSQKNKIILLR